MNHKPRFTVGFLGALLSVAIGAAADSQINVSKGAPDATLWRQIQQARQFYHAGEHAKADRLYDEVLLKQPGSRDALLGKAAISRQLNQPLNARNYYLRLLEQQPQDLFARAGLIALIGEHRPVAGVEQIQPLLTAHPTQPTLYFILGNLYARQARWDDARKAYFNAWTLDKNNPDYAHNLAITLDHLQQHAQAARFYRQALTAAAEQRASFSQPAVEQRLQELDAVSRR